MTDDATLPPVRAEEVRLLEGPNLYFPRPAVKVTLALPGYLALSKDEMAAVCRAAGLRRTATGAPGSATRQRVLMLIAQRAVRALALSAGTTRLGVRARPGTRADQVIVAFVWRHRGRAEVLGAAMAPILLDLLAGSSLQEAVARHTDAVRDAPEGAPPRIVTPRIPVVSVTGTNGKTTTTRLLAHMAMSSGKRTAWSSTDGVLAHGELIEAGDYSGPAGARAVLETPGVEIGILETARGGMLLKGLGVSHNDVSVVTNVTADHLGLQGVDTLDQLAEVKAIITQATKARGWVVLNGEDPRVWAMRAQIKARPWVFSADPNSPAIREAIDARGRAITLLDGYLTVLGDGGPDRLIRAVDVPMTLAGLSEHNIANALAAAAAGLALGLGKEAVVEGLRTFQPDAKLNPGRMNTYTQPLEHGAATVIIDLAHNEAGLEALLDVARGLVAPGGRVHLGLGAGGDRTDEILQALGEIAGRRADHVVLLDKPEYLRGRDRLDMRAQFIAGLSLAGVGSVEGFDTEIEGMAALIAGAADGDVVAIMAHSQRPAIDAWLHEHGALADDAKAIRAKAIASRGEHEAEEAIAALWEDHDDARTIAAAKQLYADYPHDPRIAYEYGGAFDAAGQEEQAVGMYREALDSGLREPYRHRALIQLASTLRNLGRLEEAMSTIDEVLAQYPDSAGASAFRALILHDLGRATEAVSALVGVLAATSVDPDVERYRRSLGNYARALTTAEGQA